MTGSISSSISASITLSTTGSYQSPFTVGSSGVVVAPNTRADGEIGVFASYNALLINFGSIIGGLGVGGKGGAGVDFTGGGTIHDVNFIEGGYGGSYAKTGAPGGDGVDLSGGTLFANGTIEGGTGGIDSETTYTGGVGGIGVSLSAAYLYVQGKLIEGGTGGLGGMSSGPMNGGAGGIGAVLVNGSRTAVNEGTIVGGTGGASYGALIGTGGVGGAGVSLSDTTFANGFGGRVAGGAGGINTGNGVGGAGGIGIIASGTGYLYNGGGTISGGTGAVGGFGVDLTGAETLRNGVGLIIGGAGGYQGGGGTGVDLGGAASVGNGGTIEGGICGNSAFEEGGAGVGIVGGGTLYNFAGALIAGGASGVGISPNGGGHGGYGVVVGNTTLTGIATLTNKGTILGGAGGAGTVVGGAGGAGVFVNGGGVLITSGTIAGGSGGYGLNTKSYAAGGDAVKFGLSVGTLIVDPGAVFVGGVVGGGIFGVTDALDLASGASAGTLSGLGSEYNGFEQITVNSGADWNLAGVNSLGSSYRLEVIGSLNVGGSLTNSGTVDNYGVLNDTGSIDNAGTISGGLPFGTTGVAGITVSGGTLLNVADVFGGNGNPLNGGAGGAGIVLDGGVVTNTGGILGGAGGNFPTGPLGGYGGDGVELDSGTLINAGNIHYGPNGLGEFGGSYPLSKAAVAFGSGIGTLIVDPGSSIQGTVLANASVEDVLGFGGSAASTLGGIGIVFDNFNIFQFERGASFTAEGTYAAFDGGQTIEGFAPSDTLVLAGFAANTADASFVSGTGLELAGTGGNTITLEIQGGFDTADFSVSSAGPLTTIALGPSAPCFAAGTRILTTRGEIAVERLGTGDEVMLWQGDSAKITWIGRRRIDLRRHPCPEIVLPVLIEAGAIADGMPGRDLYVSPDHALFLNGHLIPAKALINGRSIRQARRKSVTYYHVELPRHGVLLADEAPAESYLECGNRGDFENGGEAVRLHPDFAQGKREAESCAPFAEAGPIVEAIRRQILERAGITTTDDPALAIHYLADGSAEIRSRSAVPGHLTADPRDRRTLGVKVAALGIDGGTIPLDHPALTEGWHDMEPDGRWTNGCALVPASFLHGHPLVVRLAASTVYPLTYRAAFGFDHAAA